METPVPLVDLDRLERNLDRMAEYAAQRRLSLRPHTKTHKSPRVAAEQMRRGAVGLTCATLLEAEVMAEASEDIPWNRVYPGHIRRTPAPHRQRRLHPNGLEDARGGGCD